jgi:chromosome segregation ATPase
MMDFLQRRLESLEKELGAEKDRARAAQSLLTQQDAMRAEVESNLKGLYEQIRREKSERESEEMKSHARGRIDVLEQRLDEMHQTWASLLKDAISNRDGAAKETLALQADLRREVGAVADALSQLSAQLPELRGLVGQVPAEERRGFTQVAERLSRMAADVQDRLAALERRQAQQAESLEARVLDLTRERAALQEAWQEQNHAVHRESAKERMLRENQLGEQVSEICRRLDEMARAQQTLSGGAGEVKAEVGKVLSLLNTPPRVKEQIIADLEKEKTELLRALKDRSETLHAYIEDRKAVEKTLGDSMLALNARLDQERETAGQALRQAAQAEDKIASLQAQVEEKDRRLESLATERDALTRSLVQEAEKVRTQIDERGRSEADWTRRVADMQKKLEEKLAQIYQEGLAVAELRSQTATLSEHLARALQEKEAVVNRFAAWERDRQALIAKIREKDEMIALLSSSFQNMLKK